MLSVGPLTHAGRPNLIAGTGRRENHGTEGGNFGAGILATSRERGNYAGIDRFKRRSATHSFRVGGTLQREGRQRRRKALAVVGQRQVRLDGE